MVSKYYNLKGDIIVILVIVDVPGDVSRCINLQEYIIFEHLFMKTMHVNP